MFTHYVMFARSTATMDVNLLVAVVPLSGGGLVYMKRVTTADPDSSPRRSCRRSVAFARQLGGKEVDERLNHPELWGGNWNQLCGQPPSLRHKHCAVRIECVARFDHYCPWMVTRSESAITEISSSFSVSRRLPWRWRSSSPSFA